MGCVSIPYLLGRAAAEPERAYLFRIYKVGRLRSLSGLGALREVMYVVGDVCGR